MNILFFIIFPLATILIAIVLQKLLRSPILVAILTFAIFLIVTYTVYTPDFLLNTIIYTLLAFLTALIVKWICFLIRELTEAEKDDENDYADNDNSNNNCCNMMNNCSCGCNQRRRRRC